MTRYGEITNYTSVTHAFERGVTSNYASRVKTGRGGAAAAAVESAVVLPEEVSTAAACADA
jgi:hypothetical protein